MELGEGLSVEAWICLTETHIYAIPEENHSMIPLIRTFSVSCQSIHVPCVMMLIIIQ